MGTFAVSHLFPVYLWLSTQLPVINNLEGALDFWSLSLMFVSVSSSGRALTDEDDLVLSSRPGESDARDTEPVRANVQWMTQ